VHFDLPKDWVEGKVHFWSVWKSADGKLISTSAYHGMIELGEQETGNEEQATGNVEQTTGIVEQVTGNGEQVTGNVEQAIGNMEQVTGNMEQVTGNGEQVTENGKQAIENKERSSSSSSSSLESPGITDKISGRVNTTEKKKTDISVDEDRPKKWAPPGFYSRRNKLDKLAEPNVLQDQEEKQEEGPRSVLEAMPPHSD
ncbi:MAG: hypothetical protein ACRCVU_01880, partial [Flavobacterium sp.]